MGNCFPANSTEALTMLYLQNQDLSRKTPEEIDRLYWETYYRISSVNKANEAEFRKAFTTTGSAT